MGSEEGIWPVGLSLSQCGPVFANSVRYILINTHRYTLSPGFPRRRPIFPCINVDTFPVIVI